MAQVDKNQEEVNQENEKVQFTIAKVELNLYRQSTQTIVRLKMYRKKIGEVLFWTFLRFGKDLITKYHTCFLTVLAAVLIIRDKNNFGIEVDHIFRVNGAS